ncbi:MAG: ATP-binding cassette domain-containing protein [Pseudomonadota bacterium]
MKDHDDEDAALSAHVRRKAFGSAEILHDVALQIGHGERVAMLGPSGCGKSTLLAILAGIDRDFDGSLTRDRGRLAMVFQSPRLLPWRTLTQNIALLPDVADGARARAALAEVGLADHADAYPQMVSLGQQRRAALARALAIDPKIILLDEPLVSLDPRRVRAMLDLIRRVFDTHEAAALIATHDRREALALADRLIELGGRPATLVSERRSPLSRQERCDPCAVEEVYQAWFGSEADTGTDKGAGANPGPSHGDADG